VGGATSRVGLVFLALALAAFFQLRSDNFATTDNLLSIMVNVAGILVVSIAMARLVIAGQIDLSVGGMLALVAVACAWVMRETDSIALGVLTGLGVGLALGLLNGWLVLRLRISPIIVTLALLGVYSGFAFVITQSVPIFELPPDFALLGRTRLAGIPLIVIIAVVLFVGGAWALTRTVGGIRSYAIGGSPNAASVMGVDVDRHLLMLYGYVGLSVGVVGVLTVARLGSASPNLGVGFELDVVTAVILGGVGFAGGTGRPFGVFFGVVTIGILNAGLIFVGVSDYWQTIARGMVLLLALAADQLAARWRQRVVKPRSDARQGQAEQFAGEEDDYHEQLRAHVPAGEVALFARNLAKAYGAVVAVRDVSLEVRAGQVTCLLGDNGAGKSSVIKMLSGVVAPDGGDIELVERGSLVGLPAVKVRELGVETVYQDLAVCSNLGAAYNLSLGREPRRLGRGSLALFDTAHAIKDAESRLSSLGIALDDYLMPVESLSGGQRQCVAIARAQTGGVKVVILDEPTAALGVRQRSLVLRLARRLADSGAAVLVITHDVESVKLLADRVVVLNLGAVSFTGAADDITTRDLVHLMAGLPLESDSPTSAGRT
jgi:ribose/xylose/arabinose/galactoside ABC-type transport system permease subunit/ABC-type multidrug transport system ATPase subunit